MKNMHYWYDDQIRKYLLQLVRVFSHFQIKEQNSFNRVPAIYGNPSRVVANILQGNSEKQNSQCSPDCFKYGRTKIRTR